MSYQKSKWRLNTEQYLAGLILIEKFYKDKKINKKEKKEKERKLDSLFEKNYWKFNPNLKEPVLKEIFIKIFNTFEIKPSELKGKKTDKHSGLNSQKQVNVCSTNYPKNNFIFIKGEIKDTLNKIVPEKISLVKKKIEKTNTGGRITRNLYRRNF